MRNALTLFIFLFILGPIANAEENPLYKVEFLLFLNQDSGDYTPELNLEDPGLPDLGNAWSMQGFEPAFPPLDPQYRNLNPHRLQLNRSGRYRSLIHEAWLQPIGPNSPKLAFQIPVPNAGAIGPPTLEGTLRLTRKRYLHAELDFLQREQDLSAPPDPQGFNQPVYKQFRMQQKRRMRSEELHYIDSARLGALIIISPYEEPETETQEAPEQAQPTPQ